MDSSATAPNLFTAIALVIASCGATHAIMAARRQRGLERVATAAENAKVMMENIPTEGEGTNRNAAEKANQSRKRWAKAWELSHDAPMWCFMAIGFTLSIYVVCVTYQDRESVPTCDWTYLRWPLIISVVVGAASLWLSSKSLRKVRAAMKEIERCQSTAKDSRFQRQEQQQISRAILSQRSAPSPAMPPSQVDRAAQDQPSLPSAKSTLPK